MGSLQDDLRSAIQAVEDLLCRRTGFGARAQAIEALETHVFDRLAQREERGPLPAKLRALRADAVALRQRLEASNEQVVRRLQREVMSGRRGASRLRRALVRHAGPARREGGYDTLDLLVARVLDVGAVPPQRVALGPEMVPYQPTPARAILALVQRAAIGPDDVLYDVGAGLGWVVILVALLSGARARGIELEPAYCEYAARSARRLKVRGVQFARGDARAAPLTGGTVFFLYTPFRGALLRDVLERLRRHAKAGPIRVCTLGPCTAEVARATWLARANRRSASADDVTVFHSIPFP